MRILVADEEGKFGGIDVSVAILHAASLKTERAPSEPLRFGHVADQDELGLASGVVLVAELVEKRVEFFGTFLAEKAEIFVCLGTHAVDEMIESGLLGVGGPC